MDAKKSFERNFTAKTTTSRLKSTNLSQSTQDFYASLITGQAPIYQVRQGIERFAEECCAQEVLSKYDTQVKGFSQSLRRMAERRLLRKAEAEFIYSFYGLLSDSVNHRGMSFAEPRASRYVATYFIGLSTDRILKKRVPPQRKNDLLPEEVEFASAFIQALRGPDLLSDDFQRDFGIDLMNEIRQRCEPEDFHRFLRNVTSDSVDDKVRADCASLILNPWIHHNHFETLSRMSSELYGYFHRFFERNSWRGNRCLALALENQASRGEAVVRLVESFDETTREKNLDNADRYHNESPVEAASTLGQRLMDEKTPLCANVWGVYYIMQRGERNTVKKVRTAVQKRLYEVSDEKVSRFLSSIVRA